MSAIDLDKFKSLTGGTAKQINDLANELKNAMEDTSHGAYYRGRYIYSIDLDTTDHYGLTDSTEMRDLYYWAKWLSREQNIPDREDDPYAGNIRTFASNIMTYLTDGSTSQKCVIAEKHASGQPASQGLSIYLPDTSNDWDEDIKSKYNDLDWAINTNWDEMLDAKWPQ
jgi:hypothetical protein